jgi:hypothetical protein
MGGLKMWARAALCAAAVMLTACATKYQDMGFSGGVAAEQVTADTYRIKARGNAYTQSTTVQDYVLLKAAETTKAAGATHFALVGANDASRATTITTPGTMNTSVVGNTAFTTYSPGSTDTYIKPGQDAYIRVMRLPPGQAAPPGTFAADEIIQFVGSRIARG